MFPPKTRCNWILVQAAVTALLLGYGQRADAETAEAAAPIEPHATLTVPPFPDSWSSMAERSQDCARRKPAGLPDAASPLHMPASLGQKIATPAEAEQSPAPSITSAQAIGDSFPAVSMEDQIVRFSLSSRPPDTMGAVGPDHFMEVINGSVAVFERTNHSMRMFVRLDEFFSYTVNDVTYPRGRAYDPRVLYDRRSGRWFASTLEFGEPTGASNHVLLAVSATRNPLGLWSKYLVALGEKGQSSDYETLGVDDNGIYIAAGMFPTSGVPATANAKIAALSKAPLLAGTAVSISFFTGISDMFASPQPAHNLDPVGPSGAA